MDKKDIGCGHSPEAMNEADKEKVLRTKLEEIATYLTEIKEAGAIVDGEFDRYSKLGQVLDKFTVKGAYQRAKDGCDYVFSRARKASGLADEANKLLDEVIESYKEK